MPKFSVSARFFGPPSKVTLYSFGSSADIFTSVSFETSVSRQAQKTSHRKTSRKPLLAELSLNLLLRFLFLLWINSICVYTFFIIFCVSRRRKTHKICQPLRGERPWSCFVHEAANTRRNCPQIVLIVQITGGFMFFMRFSDGFFDSHDTNDLTSVRDIILSGRIDCKRGWSGTAGETRLRKIEGVFDRNVSQCHKSFSTKSSTCRSRIHSSIL